MLAVCFLECLPRTSLTLANARRYVTSDLLSSYCIRNHTKISDADRIVALDIAMNAVKGKPVSFRFAKRGSPIAIERRNYILAGLADPDRAL